MGHMIVICGFTPPPQFFLPLWWVLYAYSPMFCLTQYLQQNLYFTSESPLHDPNYCELIWWIHVRV